MTSSDSGSKILPLLKAHPKVLAKAGAIPKVRAPGLTRLLARLRDVEVKKASILAQIQLTCTHAEDDLEYTEEHGTSPYHCRTFTNNHILTCRACGKVVARHYYED